MTDIYPQITGQPVGEPEIWDFETDVVVLGSGAAGLFAAVEATESGAEVIVLESQPETGGSSRLSSGYVTLCETDLVPGGRNDLLQDLEEAHHHDSHFELSRVYVENAADTWLRLKDLGLEFVGTMQFAHMSRPWAHEPGGIGGGAEIISRLENAARRRGAEIRMSTRAVALIHNPAGRITGVVADIEGRLRTFRACKAVIAATGGFTRDLGLIRQHGRKGADMFLPVTAKGSQGDGLRMGMGAGAATSYLEIGIAPTVPVDPTRGDAASLVNYKGAILVNRHGKRFCQESDVYLNLSWAGIEQPEQTMIQVYDSTIRQDYLEWRLSATLGLCKEHTAPEIPQLAALLESRFGVDAAALVETVATYNRYVDAGHDPEFGRTNLVGSSGALCRVEAGPFYASVLRPGTTHFNGGLRVNRNMQVLRIDGEIIPGLYGAGEITGGFHGAGYMSGTFLGSALMFGRIAGRNAADERRAWGDLESGSFQVPSLP